MFKKTIEYVDYNGVTRNEDFYFNLTASEAIILEAKTPGGLTNYLDKIIRANSGAEIMAAFAELIHMAYGRKSDDGRTFEKSDEISKTFESTPAYDTLFLELCTDEKAASDFVNGIMPKFTDAQQKHFKLVAEKAAETTPTANATLNPDVQ